MNPGSLRHSTMKSGRWDISGFKKYGYSKRSYSTMKSGRWDISGFKKYMHIPRDHTLQWNQVDEIFLG